MVSGDDHKAISDEICKIGRVGTYFWAATGFVTDGKEYDVAKLTVNAGVRSQSLDETAARFNDLFLPAILKSFKVVPSLRSSEFLSGSKPILTVVFAGAEGGKLKLHIHSFICGPGADGDECTVQMRDECQEHCSTPEFIYSQGADEGSYLTENRDFLRSFAPVDAARILVGRMMHDAPDRIGGTIEVLQLTPLGGVWVDDPLGCAKAAQGDFYSPNAKSRPVAVQAAKPAAREMKMVNGRPLDSIEFGTLEITSTPLGAQVWFEGVLVGLTPTSVTTTTGQHAIRIGKKGYKPWEKNVEFFTGVTKITAELQSSKGAPVPANSHRSKTSSAPR